MNKFVLTMALLLFGGFYDWNAAFLGCLVCLYAIVLYHRKISIYKKGHRLILWIPEIIIVFQIFVFFWAVDRSAHIAGIMRGIIILIWMHTCLQEDAVDEKLMRMIPRMGEYMVLTGCAALCFEKVKPFFWRAGRFGGFFQYANTCALFLLLGIAINYFGNGEADENTADRIKKSTGTAILLLGLLLTGSRGILILSFLWGIWRGIRDKRFRRIFIPTVFATGTVLGVYYLLTGEGTQNINRIFTMIRHNSTFYGRILYDIDGISILQKYPMGLGYMGYFYVQHMLQTGVYTVRFVHNDILQMGLDYGIIPMLLFVTYMAWQLVKGGQAVWKKEILAIIMAASVTDFHMQYIVIDFIAVLCVDLGGRQLRQRKPERLENSIVFGIFLLGFAFLLIPYAAVYGKRYDVALRFMPDNTEALQGVMMAAGDSDTAAAYADMILSNNRYVAEAYSVKAYAAALENDLDSVISNQDEILRLKKYDAGRYGSYDVLLEQLAARCMKEGEYQQAGKLETKRKEIREQLGRLREQTNPIAYRLKDKPQYELRKENEK